METIDSIICDAFKMHLVQYSPKWKKNCIISTQHLHACIWNSAVIYHIDQNLLNFNYISEREPRHFVSNFILRIGERTKKIVYRKAWKRNLMHELNHFTNSASTSSMNKHIAIMIRLIMIIMFDCVLGIWYLLCSELYPAGSEKSPLIKLANT